MSFKDQIKETIMKNRPKLSASSVKTYISILTNIHKSMKGTGDNITFFDNDKEVLEYLKDKQDSSKKTALSALYVLTEKPEYRELINTIMKKVNDAYKEQKKDVKQTENWVSVDDIKTIYDGLLVKAKSMLSNKSIFDSNTMMQFLLVTFLGGVSGIIPRRSLDYALLKIKNINVKTDNYYKSGKLYFNVYKTAKNYGLQSVDLPADINAIIKKWIKINPTDYMLYSSNKQPLTSQSINRILNTVFKKNVSTNILRHVYVSDKYKNIPALTQMETLSNAMGHNLITQLEYIKH